MEEKGKKKTAHLKWNFAVDYNDHFETPTVAYEDLIPALKLVATALKKPFEDLVIYDPYWCQGQMVSILNNLGFVNVINRNRDFYADIKNKCIPEYDILITNPPYSGEHKVRLIEYLKNTRKPFCLLLPAYTATKSYWRDFSESITKVYSEGLVYLMPPNSYSYCHPEGTGKDLPPFYSSWFIGRFPKVSLLICFTEVDDTHK